MASAPPAQPTEDQKRIAALEGELSAVKKANVDGQAVNKRLNAELDATGKKLAEVVAENTKLAKAAAQSKSSSSGAAPKDWRPWADKKVDRGVEENAPTNASDANDLGAPSNQTK